MGAWHRDVGACASEPLNGLLSASLPYIRCTSIPAGRGHDILPTSWPHCRAAAPAAHRRQPASNVDRCQLVDALQPQLAIYRSAGQLVEPHLHEAAAACQSCGGTLPRSS
jgi:hypothetical protein